MNKLIKKETLKMMILLKTECQKEDMSFNKFSNNKNLIIIIF